MVAERWPSQSFMVGDLDAGGTKPYRARKGVPRVPFRLALAGPIFAVGAILRNGFVVDKILKGTKPAPPFSPSPRCLRRLHVIRIGAA